MVILHTLTSLLSYAAFLVAFIAGGLFLVQERQLKRKRMGLLFHRLPSLGTLDQINFWALGIGFGLLTFGMALGLIGVRLWLGRWWVADAKTYFAIVLWLAYLGLWIMRVRATLRGRPVAFLSVLGFCLVLFTVVGASWLLPSAHPYL